MLAQQKLYLLWASGPEVSNVGYGNPPAEEGSLAELVEGFFHMSDGLYSL